MQKRTKLYIAYGSNLNIEQMQYRCPAAKPVGVSELPGYTLLFRGEYNAVATIEPGEDDVPVLLWRVTPEDERALDVYEGWPHLYRKETLEVELDGAPVDAMIYIMNGNPPLGMPTQRYYETILEGYESAGFDMSALDRALERSEAALEIEPAEALDFRWWE
ncbi:MAG: gamma-glutamylcyclotransferase [Oscillospiraceae bacterium]|jgi:gamma-glutamylcyclotransferase (GGCT)/AIG2-like uncharacterized protein YtfP|nr:gamma-glutamylcyclotransferase [Oscillospiraceae bacterium]